MLTAMEEEVMIKLEGDDTAVPRLQPRQRQHDENTPPFMEPFTALGQFSFAPATQTTVVTTTTTTTTKFPPLLMRPPRRRHELDTKLYPLASSPTPLSLKNISFMIEGKPTIFREAENAALALEELQEEQTTLRKANGAVRTVEDYREERDLKTIETSQPLSRITNLVGRPASPESIAERQDGSSQEILSGENYNERMISGMNSNREGKTSLRPHPRIRNARILNPVTPVSQAKSLRSDQRRSRQGSGSFVAQSSALLPSPHIEQPPSFPTNHLQPANSSTILNAEPDILSIQLPLTDDRSRQTRTGNRSGSQEIPVPTPPIDADESAPFGRPSSRRGASSIPTRLYVSDSPSAHDGSLPSPRLSPVTSSATIQNPAYYEDTESTSDAASQIELHSAALNRTFDQTPSRIVDDSSPNATQEDHYPLTSRFTHFTVADIPMMLDYFEAIPDELKSYVMHQLLRRCPKETLHVIADAVNPALRCDFLTILPPELALSIVRYLDLQSLCKAAQVSRKWRQLINNDEKVWKELFEADGFTLPEGELQKAMIEGWGWQDPHGLHGHEQDISEAAIRGEGSLPSSSQSMIKGQTGMLRRSKRKAASLVSDRSKQIKRKTSSREGSVDLSPMDWVSQLSTVEEAPDSVNPVGVRLTHPAAGLSSLKGHHLYKSLYRRHYIIRRNWLQEDNKPEHIAFRAHDTHVVTCLQFDTEKILTGSDDNNINVYDTKTGALRAKLVGHEGGVWALQYEGNILVSGSTDRSVRVWNIEAGMQRQVFRGHTSTVRCLQIVTPIKVGENAEGKAIMVPRQPLIITGSRDSTLRVWRLPRPDDPVFIQSESDHDADECPYFVRTLTGHQHSVRAIAAHADTLVSGSYDCTVRVWKISTGETVHRLQGHTQKVYSVVLDHSRNRCISGSMDNMVRIWSLDTGSLIHTLEGHTSLVGLLDLNSDRLVSAAADSTLRIWDPESGQCKATLSAHTGAITCFQHDGQKVISGSDRTLKLWNIKSGECIKDLLSDLSGVWQVKFNERKCVAAVQRDGLTYIEVLDFGAARDGISEGRRGRRRVVDADGYELNSEENGYLDHAGGAD